MAKGHNFIQWMKAYDIRARHILKAVSQINWFLICVEGFIQIYGKWRQRLSLEKDYFQLFEV
jgi:hypothetical protein